MDKTRIKVDVFHPQKASIFIITHSCFLPFPHLSTRQRTTDSILFTLLCNLRSQIGTKAEWVLTKQSIILKVDNFDKDALRVVNLEKW